jgi:hypothetical protein
MKDACREAFEAWVTFPSQWDDEEAFAAGWHAAMAHAVDLCKRRMMRECKTEFDTAQTMEACAIAALLPGGPDAEGQ